MQEGFADVPDLLDGLRSGSLPAARRAEIVNGILRSGGPELPTRLPELMASLANLSAPATEMMTRLRESRGAAYAADVQRLVGREPLRSAPPDVQEVAIRALARRTPAKGEYLHDL